MKKFAKRCAALALCAAMLVTSAGAKTSDGEDETWFDSVWSLIGGFSLGEESNPYVLQNYINKYLEEHPEEMYNVFNDILSLMDTHSMYLSAEQYAAGFPTLEGFVGIGVGLKYDVGGILIDEVLRFSSAEEAGLLAGDLIVRIDGADATNLSVAGVAERLRGPEDTSVTVTVRRQGREIEVTCVRRRTNYVYVTNRTMADGVEYVKVSAIGSQNDWTVFDEIWQGLDEKNTRAVILDLRGNGGGVVDVAFKMIDAMTQRADVYLGGERYRADMGGLHTIYSTGGGLPLNEIVVLVDGETASAAELIAGSLKDTGAATVVGTQTYGKGQGQFHFDLINGDKLVITTMELELPKAGVYEGVGITPDLVLENERVTVDVSALTPLLAEKPLYFGQSSDAVYAMTERLSLLGLLGGARNVLDSEALDAVQEFEIIYELPMTQYAPTQVLSLLDQAMQTLDGQTFVIDRQLDVALAICKTAAAKPQQYVSLADGSWTRR